MGKDYLFEKLKEILFEQEREEQEQLKEHVERIDEEINTREELEPRIEPILNDKITYLQQNFPVLFGSSVTKAIKKEIRESQDEVVEALYPIMGKMIKKYVVKEMEVLSERIDNRIEAAFSFSGWVRRLKGWFGGAKQKDIIASELIQPILEEIFVIEQESGILLGSYSKSSAFDQDMAAGMLTAIKSFVRDAFSENQELEMIEYETYKLMIKNFKSFYIVAVVSGVVTNDFKNTLDTTILDFAAKILKVKEPQGMDFDTGQLKGELQNYFAELNNGDK